MSENDKVTAQARHKGVKGSSTVRGESSDDCRMWTDTVDVTFCGRPFYTSGGDGETMLPTVDRRIQQMTSDDILNDFKEQNNSTVYCLYLGTCSLQHLCVFHSPLYVFKDAYFTSDWHRQFSYTPINCKITPQ